MYRITYLAFARPFGLTLRCSLDEALDFVEWFERDLGLKVLTLRSVQ